MRGLHALRAWGSAEVFRAGRLLSHTTEQMENFAQAASDAAPAWPDAIKPLESAVTLPAAFYSSELVEKSERRHVFRDSWQVVGRQQQLDQTGQYITGTIADCPFIVCRAHDGQIHAFHNVCRHHAAAVAEGQGHAQSFVCPYHGWTYALDGRLLKAIAIGGIKNFKAKDYRLVPMSVATWGPFIFAHAGVSSSKPIPSFREWLGAAAPAMEGAGMIDDNLVHVRSRSYTLACNWKVFCDNFLDGGYHVAIAHPDLAKGLEMGSYANTIFDRASIQTARTKPSEAVGDDRLGTTEVSYAFVYPNLMINRYGPWLDTNVVTPLSPGSCTVDFDWWVDKSLSQDDAAIDACIASSDQVQQEDIKLCEAVQRGLQSPAYNVGRYAPKFEAPMFHFHRQLYAALTQRSQSQQGGNPNDNVTLDG